MNLETVQSKPDYTKELTAGFFPAISLKQLHMLSQQTKGVQFFLQGDRARQEAICKEQIQGIFSRLQASQGV
jgi:hypothetical protein